MGEIVEPAAPLYNVEPAKFSTLGSIPTEGSELLAAAAALPPLATDNEQLMQQLEDSKRAFESRPGLNLPQFPQPSPQP